MELERLAVVVRPRRPWEAADLGFAFARQCAWRLWAPWLALVLPLALLLNLACGPFMPALAPIILWWLKPLLDRVPLHVVSRAVFGETPTVRETLRELPRLLKPGFIAALSWRRFDMARSFHLPPLQLEGLSGGELRRRWKLLNARQMNAAQGITLACVHLEAAIQFGLFGLFYLLLPHNVEMDWGLVFGDGAPLWFTLLQNGAHLLALALVEPFYVSAGFFLYLNRRTGLEGWDIEIAFRRLGARLAHREAA